MNHCKRLDGFLGLRQGPDGLRIRHDLPQGAVTMLFRDVEPQSLDTRQHSIADNLIHFLAPDGQLPGIKSLSGGCCHE